MKNSKKHFIILLAFITASLFILSGCNSKTDNLPARTPDYKEYSDSRYAEALYEITTQTDITYCTTKNYKNEDIDLKLDIYSPIGNDEQAKPAILLIHGGGLIKGDKSTDNLTKSLAMDFAKMGYVIFNVNYRLRDTASSSALKDAMTDISEAFNWIQTNCETYGVDKQRIAIGGYSSGATIAINLAYCNSSKYNIDHNSIMGVVDIAGTNLSIGSAKSNNPPCIIVHGTKDTTVSYNNAEKLKKLLTKANIENSLCPLEGANHVLTTRYDELRNRIAEFLYKQLTSKEITINTKSEISPEYLNVVQRLENNVTYEVKENVITLDGQLSEWKNTETIKLNQLKDAGESLPDANDFEGYVQFAWNEASAETLYIAAAITDNKIINNVAADGKWYHDDCLEIIFDLSNNNIPEQLLKWVIGANGTQKDFSVLATNENTQVVVSQDNNTRYYEIAINLNEIDMSIRESGKKITITNETTIGFSIAYNDTDKKEREHQIGITAGKSSERTTFANLKFVK